MASSHRRNRLRNQFYRKHCQTQQSGKDHNDRHHHLESSANDGRHLRAADILRGQNALYDQEICGPVAHGNDGAESKDNAGPVDSHGIGGK